MKATKDHMFTAGFRYSFAQMVDRAISDVSRDLYSWQGIAQGLGLEDGEMKSVRETLENLERAAEDYLDAAWEAQDALNALVGEDEDVA